MAHTSTGGPAQTITPGDTPDLRDYDFLIVNLSAKDGRAALERIVSRAAEQRVTDRILTVHADLGLMQWPGVTHRGRYWPSNRELVAEESAAYGIPPERHVVAWRTVQTSDGPRPQSLIEHIAQHRRFPDQGRSYCKSDHKRDKLAVSLTPIFRARWRELGRQVRVLNVLGLRADESLRRAGLSAYVVSDTNRRRHIDQYLPAHAMSTADVRALNDASGVAHHWAYDSEPGAHDWEGSRRLSCSLCILGGEHDLLLAARRRPRLAALYAEVEQRRGHTFQPWGSMTDLVARAAAPGGPEPGVVLAEDNAEFDQLVVNVRARLDQDIKLPGGTGFVHQADACGTCGSCV
jgi:hypothetical protein